MEDPAASNMNWTVWQKNAFRFCFLFLATTSFTAYNVFITIFNISWEAHGKLLAVLRQPIAWLDNHFYHFGFIPDKHGTFLGDGPFGWAFLLTLFFLSIIGTIIWAIADRKRNNYNRLHFWFRTYLAYYLFLTLVIYAFEKIIPVQMPYPDVTDLLTPVGDQSGFAMVWNFIGSNGAYSIFSGICELTAALLVLFRRTRIFGSLFMVTVLINVVCLNVFYNIMVKLLCLQLLVTALFLLAPYVPALFRFFYKLQPVSLLEKEYRFSTPWKKWTVMLLLLAPAWVSLAIVKKSMGTQKQNILNRKNQKLYNAEIFIRGNDTLPPLLSDTLRWKRFVFTAFRKEKMAVIYNMQDSGDYYDYDIDSIQQTITLHDNPDTLTWHVFKYRYPAPGKYQLSGKWKGQPVTVILNAVSIDSLFLLPREKTTWVHDF
jgi:hypothetical protein